MTSSPPQVCAPQLQVSEATTISATDSSKAQHLQQSSGEEDICRPLVDQVKVWEGIAAAEYGVDGSMDGWHNTQVQLETSEDAYLQVLFTAVPYLEPCICDLQVLALVLWYFGPYISVSRCTIISMSCRGGPEVNSAVRGGGLGWGKREATGSLCMCCKMGQSDCDICLQCMCVHVLHSYCHSCVFYRFLFSFSMPCILPLAAPLQV